MSAAVVPFTGKWQGHSKPAPYKGKAQARAVHDARLIMAAKADNDDWTTRLWLAFLQTLTSKQLNLLEFRLLGEMDSQSSAMALAVVHLVSGNNAHRNHVKVALAALASKGAE